MCVCLKKTLYSIIQCIDLYGSLKAKFGPVPWTKCVVLHDKGLGLRQIVDFFTEPFLIEMHHSSLPDCLMCFFLPPFTCITYINLSISNFFPNVLGHCIRPITHMS